MERPVREEHDVVLTNFPFSQETDYGGLYGLSTADANPVFLKHAIDACKPGGRIGIVVPEGLLFTETQAYISVRQHLVNHCAIHAVISLHEFVFRPYTGQPTAILILSKGDPGQDVWFCEVGEDGFKKTASKEGRPPEIDIENHLIDLRRLWADKPETERSFTVDLGRIRENSYKLSASSYRVHDTPDDWLELGGSNGVCDVILGATPSSKVSKYWQTGFIHGQQ